MTRQYKYYTDKDKQFIKDKYPELGPSKVASILGRNYATIVDMAMKLGVQSNTRFTKQQEQFIKDNYHKLPAKEIAKQMNKTPRSIMSFARRRLKLRKRQKHRSLNFSSLSSEDLAYIAGCIDCDGFIGLYKATRTDGVIRFNPRIEVVNTSKPLIEWFYNHVGGGNIQTKKRMNNSFRNVHATKPIYQWQVAAIQPIKILLENIRDRLIIKRYKADAVLSFLNGNKSGEKAINIIRGSSNNG